MTLEHSICKRGALGSGRRTTAFAGKVAAPLGGLRAGQLLAASAYMTLGKAVGPVADLRWPSGLHWQAKAPPGDIFSAHTLSLQSLSCFTDGAVAACILQQKALARGHLVRQMLPTGIALWPLRDQKTLCEDAYAQMLRSLFCSLTWSWPTWPWASGRDGLAHP